MLRQKRNSNNSHNIVFTEVFINLRDITGHSNVFLVTTGFPDNKEQIFPLYHSITSTEEQLNCGNLNWDPCCPGCFTAGDRQLADRGVFSWKGISWATESLPVILCPPNPQL